MFLFRLFEKIFQSQRVIHKTKLLKYSAKKGDFENVKIFTKITNQYLQSEQKVDISQ